MHTLRKPTSIKQPTPRSGARAATAAPPVDALTAGLLLLALGLLVLISRPLPLHLYREYTDFETYYAYGPAIPFLAAFLLWHRRKALGEASRTPQPWALAVLLPALAVLIWASGEEIAWFMGMSFLVCLWSAVWLVLGTRWTRTAAFPLFFLLWMQPLPGPLLNDATYDSQHFCTQAASRLLGLLAFHPAIVGSVIEMDSFHLFVDVPCSGLKNLLSLLMISSAFAYLLDGPPARRFALFAASAPLAVAVNVARLTLLGIAGECLGTHAARVFHDWDGLLSLLGGVAALFWMARRIGCRTFAGWPLF